MYNSLVLNDELNRIPGLVERLEQIHYLLLEAGHVQRYMHKYYLGSVQHRFKQKLNPKRFFKNIFRLSVLYKLFIFLFSVPPVTLRSLRDLLEKTVILYIITILSLLVERLHTLLFLSINYPTNQNDK